MIDTSKWKEFRCEDLFECKNTGNILARDVVDGSGQTPYVTASAFNNGVAAHIDASGYEIIKGDCILVGGKTFTITYQKEDFVSNDSHNFVIRVKDYEIGERSYLYLVSMIYTYFGQKYSWSDAVTKDKFLSEEIPLPSASDGKPDWVFMDSYMKRIMKESEESLENLRRAGRSRNIGDISEWKEFILGDLFDVVKGTRLTKADQRDGDINFISASSFNNGIAAHISNNDHVHPGNTLTVSYNGSDIGRTFYQEEPFWASDDVNVLYPKFNMNREIALFIAPIIKEVGGSHIYKDKWLQEDMKVAMIKLPVTRNGDPDWQYMEDYMKGIIKQAEESLSALKIGA